MFTNSDNDLFDNKISYPKKCKQIKQIKLEPFTELQLKNQNETVLTLNDNHDHSNINEQAIIIEPNKITIKNQIKNIKHNLPISIIKSNKKLKTNETKYVEHYCEQPNETNPMVTSTYITEHQKFQSINMNQLIDKTNEVPIIIGNIRTMAVINGQMKYNQISMNLFQLIEKLSNYEISANQFGVVELEMEHVIQTNNQCYNKHVLEQYKHHWSKFNIVEHLSCNVILAREYMDEYVTNWYPKRGVFQLVHNHQVVALNDANLNAVHQFPCCGSISPDHCYHCTEWKKMKYRVVYMDDENFIGFWPNSKDPLQITSTIGPCEKCGNWGHDKSNDGFRENKHIQW
jgi:hypothetical protein